MNKAPQKIYLQGAPEFDEFDDSTTWCTDKINEDDIEYIRGDMIETFLSLLRSSKNALRSYEYGNASKELAKMVADEIERVLSN